MESARQSAALCAKRHTAGYVISHVGQLRHGKPASITSGPQQPAHRSSRVRHHVQAVLETPELLFLRVVESGRSQFHDINLGVRVNAAQ